MSISSIAGVTASTFGIGSIKARNTEFDRLSAGEQDEYATLLHGHYVGLLRDNGVRSTQQHFELIRDKQRSDELCLDLGRRIAGDARLVELMAKLGVRSP